MTYKITDIEYLNQLKIQLSFLKADLEKYEGGEKNFTLKIATTLRTIFHDSSTSKAILPGLAEKYGIPIYFKGRNPQIDQYVTLYIGFTVGNKKPLFDTPFLVNKNFPEYWNEIVYLEGKIKYIRRQIILWAANKLGGAHFDPEIPDDLLHIIDGSVRLISNKYGEETIINQVVYEMALQVVIILEKLIPQFEITVLT